MILGFHMTSPKFKLRNNRFFWVSTFMWHYSTLKPLCKQIFGSKGFFVLRYRTFEFPGFCVTRHLADWRPGKLLCGLKTLPILGDFAIYTFLVSKWILLYSLWIPQAKNSRIKKTQKQMFLSVPRGHTVFMSLNRTQTWRLHTKLLIINLGKTFFRISRIWNIAQTWFLARLFVNYLHDFPDSRLSVLKGFHFYFWRRDRCENHQ